MSKNIRTRRFLLGLAVLNQKLFVCRFRTTRSTTAPVTILNGASVVQGSRCSLPKTASVLYRQGDMAWFDGYQQHHGNERYRTECDQSERIGPSHRIESRQYNVSYGQPRGNQPRFARQPVPLRSLALHFCCVKTIKNLLDNTLQHLHFLVRQVRKFLFPFPLR